MVFKRPPINIEASVGLVAACVMGSSPNFAKRIHYCGSGKS